jgi:hypothetical protein
MKVVPLQRAGTGITRYDSGRVASCAQARVAVYAELQ